MPAEDVPPPASDTVSSDLHLETYRRLHPLKFYESFLEAGVRPDARPLGRARVTSVAIGAVPTADGSAFVKLGNTSMLAAVKLEVMSPSAEAPEEGKIAVDFQMPPICSAKVRPGRPVEEASCVTEQLSNAISSSRMVDLRSLCISKGKAAWIAYLDIYCLDSDGSLLDAALLAAVAALMHLQLPAVLVTEDGKVLPPGESQKDGQGNGGLEMTDAEPDEINSNKLQRRSARGLRISAIPMALTCCLHKNQLLADPCAEEETILQTTLTVILDLTGKLISLYKPGGVTLATTAIVQDCIALAEARAKEVKRILDDAFAQ